jgi:predicted dehydrogenase
MQETFIKKRPELDEAEKDKLFTELTSSKQKRKMGDVTVDDATLFLARFSNGALGSFEATRMAPGRKIYEYIEVNGSKGSIYFNMEDMNALWFYSSEDDTSTQGFKKIRVTGNCHPYMSAWQTVAGIIGYEHNFVHLFYDFMKALEQGKNPSPDFIDGVECQRVLEAVEKSIQKKSWISVK